MSINLTETVSEQIMNIRNLNHKTIYEMELNSIAFLESLKFSHNVRFFPEKKYMEHKYEGYYYTHYLR